jgi:hypothetical protein
MARKHTNIEQLDGSDSLSDDFDEEDSYVKTIHYWKRGKLGSIYQHFLDVMDVIETSDLTEEAKDAEIQSAGIQKESDSSSSFVPAVFSGISCSAE